MEKGNFFESGAIPSKGNECFDQIFQGSAIKIERIISNAHSDDSDNWYDQEADEWVMLVSGDAQLLFEGEAVISLKAGDYLFIPAHKKHKVLTTSAEPPCYWLAIHGRF